MEGVSEQQLQPNTTPSVIHQYDVEYKMNEKRQDNNENHLYFLFKNLLNSEYKCDDDSILNIFLNRLSLKAETKMIVDTTKLNPNLKILSRDTKKWVYMSELKRYEYTWLPVFIKSLQEYKEIIEFYLSDAKNVICFGAELCEFLNEIKLNCIVYPVTWNTYSNEFMVMNMFNIFSARATHA